MKIWNADVTSHLFEKDLRMETYTQTQKQTMGPSVFSVSLTPCFLEGSGDLIGCFCLDVSLAPNMSHFWLCQPLCDLVSPHPCFSPQCLHSFQMYSDGACCGRCGLVILLPASGSLSPVLWDYFLLKWSGLRCPRYGRPPWQNPVLSHYKPGQAS